jgi:RimJ/RimL family protein N-acetyltransferase
MVILETERLYLRPFRQTDLDCYAEICADSEVMRYIGAGMPLLRSEAWRGMATALGHWDLMGYGLWAVEEKDSHRLIGRVGCWYPEGWPDFEVGWMLRRSAWGKGFALEAARASVQYAFDVLNRPHIVSLIAPENQRSISVAKRLGETLSGQSELLGRQVLIYSLTQKDWAKRLG